VTLDAAVKGPDAGGYVATDATVFSFLDLAATGGAGILAGADDGTAALALPFGFRFYGQMYTRACVSSNGAFYFVPDGGTCAALNDFANVDLALNTPNDWPALFPFWSDLTFQQAGAGSVLYQTTGNAGARRFIIQWDNAFPQGSANSVTFEIVLEEGTGDVVFQYKTADLGSANPASAGRLATVGVRNAGGHSNNQQIQWSANAPVIHDGLALRFSAADTAPPVVTAAATPASLWPANKKNVNVTVNGSITDARSGVASATYRVLDSYGELEPGGPVAVGADGRYSFVVPLLADRKGTDKTGRRYTIIVHAVDRAGNPAMATAVVLVPHDAR
jgi:hypothetical protein